MSPTADRPPLPAADRGKQEVELLCTGTRTAAVVAGLLLQAASAYHLSPNHCRPISITSMVLKRMPAQTDQESSNFNQKQR
eukprot:235506-Amphidinium_carterae.1